MKPDRAKPLSQGVDAPVPVLGIDKVTAGYGRSIVLRDVSLTVARGEVVALLGPNGAGKTTLLRTAAGQVRAREGIVRVRGQEVTSHAPHRRSRAGLCLVPEGRGILPGLSVKENLTLQCRPEQRAAGTDRALTAFPALQSRLGARAGSLSGGQQQMLALARCFSAQPDVVLLDEVSMGLAPLVVDEIFHALERLADAGMSVLLVEQYVTRALAMADRVYLLERGTVGFAGSPTDLDADDIMRRYLSVSSE